jgi:DNA-binding GntR family transcriptional regulator
VVPELRKINSLARDLLDGEGVPFTDVMSSFHQAIVSCCGNNTLTLLAGALGSVWVDHVRDWAKAAVDSGAFPTRASRLKDLETHQHIVDLIAGGEDLRVARVVAGHFDIAPILSSPVANQPLDARALRVSNNNHWTALVESPTENYLRGNTPYPPGVKGSSAARPRK